MRPVRAVLCMLVLVLGIGGCNALDAQQRRWVFQPIKQSWAGGAEAAGMQERWIAFESAVDAQPVRLHALWLPQADAKAPVALYLHGARWDVASSAGRMRRLHALGFSVLGIDYRGFGRSTDLLPSEAGSYEDARAAWDWLVQQHPHARRYVFGHSLGSAIAVQLATELPDDRRADGLMLEGAFTSIRDVASSFKWGWLPFGPLLTQRFDAEQRITRLQIPVLIVHGSDDRLIPPSLGRALYDKAPAPKRFVLVEGGTHHDAGAVGAAQYREAVQALFAIGDASTGTQ